MPGAPLSLYIHIPFCAKRCGYCDFNTYTATELGNGVDQSNFHNSLISEIELAAAQLGDRTVTTVFFGGGTPTLMGAQPLVELMGAVRNNFTLAPDVEITTEANPDTVTEELLTELLDSGFTRLSIGMQSTAPHVLAVLDRTHAPGASERAAKMARTSGFEHVNLDLIYGTPGETDDDLRASLETVLASGVDHVSAYALIVEDGTALSRKVESGAIPAPDDDVCADRYEIIDSILSDSGMQWYEVSNWSRPGGECLHNIAYWRNADWWGVGPGAHSHVAGTRWWNVKHPARYAAAVSGEGVLRAGEEELTAEQQHIEGVMLGVRMRGGIPLTDFTHDHRSPERIDQVTSQLLAAELIDEKALLQDRIVLTRSGRLVANRVITALLDA